MRPIILSGLLVTSTLSFLLACSPKAAGETADRIDALEDSVAILSEALGASVDLKPGDGSFSVLRIDVGSLALTFDSVVAVGAGSLVALSVANLSVAEIDGLVGTLWWGIPEEDGTHAVSERRSKLVNLTEPLAPGSWTRVAISLDAVSPDQIKFLRLSNASATSLKLP